MSGLVAMLVLGIGLGCLLVGCAVLLVVGAVLIGAAWAMWSLASRVAYAVGDLPQRIHPPTSAGSVLAPFVVEPMA